jgi:predicted regulator of Ras-like GTPase activity (Roadblock/LC7/MglB family)
VIEILNDLNEVAGVKGSMVLTRDGIVVNAALGDDLDQQNVAAMSSAMIQQSLHGLGAIGLGDFQRLILTASWGRMVFVDLEIAFLVAITSQSMQLDTILIEIDSSAYRIKNRRVQ